MHRSLFVAKVVCLLPLLLPLAAAFGTQPDNKAETTDGTPAEAHADRRSLYPLMSGWQHLSPRKRRAHRRQQRRWARMDMDAERTVHDDLPLCKINRVSVESLPVPWTPSSSSTSQESSSVSEQVTVCAKRLDVEGADDGFWDGGLEIDVRISVDNELCATTRQVKVRDLVDGAWSTDDCCKHAGNLGSKVELVITEHDTLTSDAVIGTITTTVGQAGLQELTQKLDDPTGHIAEGSFTYTIDLPMQASKQKQTMTCSNIPRHLCATTQDAVTGLSAAEVCAECEQCRAVGGGGDVVVTRRALRDMPTDEQERFALAVETMMKGEPGDSHFWKIAGHHGFPWYNCVHGDETFPHWHRIYLAEFEKLLQRADLRNGNDGMIALPYWDW